MKNPDNHHYPIDDLKRRVDAVFYNRTKRQATILTASIGAVLTSSLVTHIDLAAMNKPSPAQVLNMLEASSLGAAVGAVVGYVGAIGLAHLKNRKY